MRLLCNGKLIDAGQFTRYAEPFVRLSTLAVLDSVPQPVPNPEFPRFQAEHTENDTTGPGIPSSTTPDDSREVSPTLGPIVSE